MSLLQQAHHDGSALYVDNQAPALGEDVNLWARCPAGTGVTEVHVRAVEDGEPRFFAASVDRRDGTHTWWRAKVTAHSPVTGYRFLLRLSDGGYRWLNGTGPHRHDVTDDEDFRLTTYAPPPAWAQGAVVYEIFPDRFASSGAVRPLPEWAVKADWYQTEVADRGRLAGAQVFGGDLAGIEAHLDFIEQLGPNVVYLTPFFRATSAHRYDADTFDVVDPLLGGNEALASLSSAAHRRGMRLLGDLTTNHTGWRHEWFKAAQADPSGPEHGFYYWQEAEPGYVSWLGHAQLPKLNYRSRELWERLVSGGGSVTSRWLQAPYHLDGWRVDVANMTGRHRADDFNAEIARAMRATMAIAQPDALLVAEHGHDFTPELRGDGWHGAMNYAGFTKPLWSWMAPADNEFMYFGQPLDTPRKPGGQVARTMSEFMARVPWRVAAHHFNLLCSHDTARFRTVTGDRVVAAVGAALMFSFPGIPMVFSGDEIGLEGSNGESSRRPFPWDRPGTWDGATLATYKDLIALRKSSAALQRGGMRWAHTGDDALCYLRETAEETMLVLLTRAPGSDIVLNQEDLGWSGEAANRFGGAPLRASDGKVVLPGDGPMAQIWQLA